jgi:AraC-like DNA-binding protein
LLGIFSARPQAVWNEIALPARRAPVQLGWQTMTVRFSTSAPREDAQPRRTAWPGVIAVEAFSRHAFGRHTHDEFGIGVLLEGAQDSASGRGPVRAEAGQVITVNPGEVHDGRPVGGAPRRWRMLYFPSSVLARAFEGIEAAPGSELAHPVLDRPTAASAFLALHAAASGTASGLAVESLLVETVSHLVERRSAGRRLAASVITPARRLLDEDPSADWRLEALAALCGVSRFHFLRAFRAATGLPPHAYQVQRRLHLARRMILDGVGLAEAAAAAGFADQSHFTRHFRRSYGHTPGRLAWAR